MKWQEIELIGLYDRAMSSHVHKATSQKLEKISSISIPHWKAYNFNFNIDIYPQMTFSPQLRYI